MASVKLPEKVVEAIRRRGLDLETFIVKAIEHALRFDPEEELLVWLDIAKHMLQRAKEELMRRDAVQASEKLYKVVEECVKILACIEDLEECRIAREEGRWWTKLLSKAARKLSQRLNEKLVVDAWSQGYDLHIHRFHEHSLDVEDVEQSLSTIENLLRYTEQVLNQKLAKQQHR